MPRRAPRAPAAGGSTSSFAGHDLTARHKISEARQSGDTKAEERAQAALNSSTRASTPTASPEHEAEAPE